METQRRGTVVRTYNKEITNLWCKTILKKGNKRKSRRAFVRAWTTTLSTQEQYSFILKKVIDSFHANKVS